MSSLIVVHPKFDRVWPWAADHLHSLWKGQGMVQFVRLQPGDTRSIAELATQPESVTRLVTLAVPVSEDELRAFTGLKEAVIGMNPYSVVCPAELRNYLEHTQVNVYSHTTEGYWGQSVSEFGLALTLNGLRRIPQTHHEMMTSPKVWDYEPPGGIGQPGLRGQQFGDNPNFTNGTVQGKRIRIVGAGNIASRYASFVRMLGADVAAWDPFASEPSFHRAGSRRELHLGRLVEDAEIFVPMVPLTETTTGLIHSKLIRSLPAGCLVVLVTRAGICDMEALRERVLNDELSLAADVFDVEPLPLDDPLLGRHNVVHTPHNAGRTMQANQAWAEKLHEQFFPVPVYS
ncbi:Phosphoglycerate dehydrogenase [Paenibacillus sp. 1_12]|uniref:NAD(P)-dependent oxidoreductase n=1 Tax=Paenibacillus sp. 1_12 TaxID=1566278 RepID=UPI0008F3AF2C|nr:NAD(P)-dependent oxidoreductase [Paenibacillus sp. 1_12]SFM38810.1 Phosphoglycerate dehydrogenase [Paenibacillus sp. 1_12]